MIAAAWRALGLLALLALGSVGAAFAQAPSPAGSDDWSGEWRSFWRGGQAMMSLEQRGDRVVGRYEPGEGRIEGVAGPDGVLTGTWTEPEAGGAFTFALSSAGASFAGRFDNGEYWNGTRLLEGRRPPTPFSRADTPRAALRTIVAAANASAEGRADAVLIWEPLLVYAPDDVETNRRLNDRRLKQQRLIDMMTFRISDAPTEGEDGRAEFAIGPDGARWRMRLSFVEGDDGLWRLVVPSLAELDVRMASALEALGYDSYHDYASRNLHHPRQIMRDFLTGVATWDEGGRELALSTLDLSDITPSLHAIEGPLSADFLRQIIDRVGYVIWQEIPDDPNRPLPYVHYRHAEGDIAIVPIRDVEGEVIWRFAAETLRAAPAIYEAIQSLPVAEGLAEPRPFSDFFRLRRGMKSVSPALVERRFLLETWQWLALGATFLGLGALLRLLGPAIRWSADAVHRLARMDETVRAPLREHLVWPVRLIAFGLVLRAVIGEIGLRRDFLEVLGMAGAVSLALGLAALAFRLAGILGGYFIHRASLTSTYVDDIVASLATGLVKLAIVISAIVALAEIVGLPYEGVVAGIGIGGLALAIAARDTVSNFFGAAILMLDGPFKRGDVVEIGGEFSIVEGVGLRSTRLRTFEDSQLIIPNGKLADATINNLGRRRQRRITIRVGLTYDTPRAKLDAFVSALRETFLSQPQAMSAPVFVGLVGFADSAIEVELIGNFATADHGAFIDAQSRLVGDIVACAERVGVSFAFPTRTINVAPPFPEAGAGAGAVEARAG